MDISIHGDFIARGYNGFQNSETQESLESVLRSAFPIGSIVAFSVTATLIGQMPLCEESNKYGKCRALLNEDGSCPNVDSHKVEEKVAA